MNWGNRLLLVFVIFGGGISYMVYRCMRTPVDLVSEHYYKDELAYQQVIDGKRRAEALSSAVSLRLIDGGICVVLPREMERFSVQGSVRFYCPADAVRDREFALYESRQVIPASAVQPGGYTVKVAWVADGVGYFSEQSLVVP